MVSGLPRMVWYVPDASSQDQRIEHVTYTISNELPMYSPLYRPVTLYKSVYEFALLEGA
jgi:hypothetical protein